MCGMKSRINSQSDFKGRLKLLFLGVPTTDALVPIRRATVEASLTLKSEELIMQIVGSILAIVLSWNTHHFKEQLFIMM